MTPEEQAAQQAALTLRHENDTAFLRTVGQALEAEAMRRRSLGEPALTPETAAALIAAQPQ